MSDTQLGQLITGAGERDAIHVALAPVTANERLKPGQHIGFVGKEYNARELVGVCSEPLGIVDPFLERSVERGERFYMVLYQNTVTGLKHQWTHPAFPDPNKPDVARSVAWLQDLADEIGLDYHTLLDHIPDGSIHTGDREMYGVRESDDIRRHYEIVTGRPAPRDVYFRCAC